MRREAATTPDPRPGTTDPSGGSTDVGESSLYAEPVDDESAEAAGGEPKPARAPAHAHTRTHEGRGGGPPTTTTTKNDERLASLGEGNEKKKNVVKLRPRKPWTPTRSELPTTQLSKLNEIAADPDHPLAADAARAITDRGLTPPAQHADELRGL